MTDYQPLIEGVSVDTPTADNLREAFINLETQLAAIQNVDVDGNPLVNTPNLVWCSGDGSDAEASFRPLVSDDLPTTISGTGKTLNGIFNSGGLSIDGTVTVTNGIAHLSNVAYGVETYSTPTHTIDQTKRIQVLTASTTANNVTTLPASSGLEGVGFLIINLSDYKLTLTPDGSDTIDGLSTYSLAPRGTIELVLVGSNWIPFYCYNPAFIRLSGGNGYGSTNNNIRRFSTIVEDNSNGVITYNDSASDGASFTINQQGVYAIVYKEDAITNSRYGASLNSSQLSTNIQSINSFDRILVTRSDESLVVSGTFTALANDVVRPHTNGTPTSTSNVEFSIWRVG